MEKLKHFVRCLIYEHEHALIRKSELIVDVIYELLWSSGNWSWGTKIINQLGALDSFTTEERKPIHEKIWKPRICKFDM